MKRHGETLNAYYLVKICYYNSALYQIKGEKLYDYLHEIMGKTLNKIQYPFMIFKKFSKLEIEETS